MAAALLLARPLAGLARPRAAALLAAALLALIAWQGLAPFDFQLAPDRFALLPFGESLTQYRAANLADMFLRVLHERRPGLAAVPGGPVGPSRPRASEPARCSRSSWCRPGCPADRGDHRPAARRVRRRADRRLRAGEQSVNGVRRTGEHDPRRDGLSSKHDPGARRPVARCLPGRWPHRRGARAHSRGDRSRSRRRATAPLPEATAPQQAKPAAPRQQLRILPQDSRMEAYQQFRSLYDLARFDEALPLAKHVVELSEASAERDHELPIAYNNLGATQYQLADYPAAEGSYRKSLELLESTQGISSRRLVVPLAGLGAVYAAQDQHAGRGGAFRPRARGEPPRRRPLQPAAAAAHRAGGGQPLRDQRLRRCRARTHLRTQDRGAELRLRRYAHVAGAARARGLSTRACASSSRPGTCTCARATSSLKPGVYDPQAVKALVGIARTHRLQYTMDPDTLDSQQPARDEVTGDIIGKVYKESRVPPPAADRTGLKAAQTALDLLRSTSNPPADTHDGNADRARRLVPGDVATGRSRSPTTPRPPGSSMRR